MSTQSEALLTTNDGVPLALALRRAQSRARLRAFLLVFPLLAFIVITFIWPIGQMLYRSIYDDKLIAVTDHASKEKTPIMLNLRAWFDKNPKDSPIDESAYEALALDLQHLSEHRAAGQVGTRINYEIAGSRSLFTSGARKAKNLEAPYEAAITKLSEKWADPKLWRVMRGAIDGFSLSFYLAAVDLDRDATGEIMKVSEDRRVYVKLFVRTFFLSATVTILCFLLGFPLAHLLANLPLRYSNLLMILVLLPFWTSLLVRTTSWMVLLQSQGVLNDVFVGLGIIGDQSRIQMMYNMTGTIIAMTHILLPFMILPLYSVMRTINPSYVRAARSLGATTWTAFWRVYFPQTVPGIGAGALLVFILAMGYYITPALVGGSDGQLISNLIAFHMQKSLNWSLGASLAAILLFAVLLLYWLYDRLVGIDNMKLG